MLGRGDVTGRSSSGSLNMAANWRCRPLEAECRNYRELPEKCVNCVHIFLDKTCSG